MSAAQPALKMPVVGILSSSVRGSAYRDLVEGLRRAGYVEGKNVNFETCFIEGKPAAFPGFASELVKHGVDAIYGVGPAAVKAARDSTQTIPIVGYVDGKNIGIDIRSADGMTSGRSREPNQSAEAP